MHLFFQAYIPQDQFGVQEGDYAFSRKEIINICRESLSILFAEYDDFAASLCKNLAKSIYLICGQKWDAVEPISLRRLERSFKQANDLEVKMLSLLYGTIGLINID
jgi:hypothetical protein